MDDEMQCHFLGPIPVKEFFRKFLPAQKLSEEDRAALPGFEFEAMADAKEHSMYEGLANTVNSYCSSIRAYSSAKDSAIESDAKYKPDIVFYEQTKKLPEGRVASFQQMELFVEFERESTSDPLPDTGKSGCKDQFRKLFNTTCATRERMTLYSTQLQMYQFRTCVFAVGIFGKVARFFRWDRAGASVSAPIKYSTAGNRELAEFFYRFNRMNPVQRGWDPTVCDATAEDAAAFTQAIRTVVGGGNAALLGSLLESVGKPADYPRKKISVIYGSGKRASYIVGRSSVTAKTPTGRATCCFVAMDAETKGLVFLKDSWRLNMAGMKSEGHWYKRLKGGEYIAAFSHGSDVGRIKKGGGVGKGGNVKKGEKVRPQRTVTQNYLKRCCNSHRMMGYTHYRTVQSEFYVPLKMFKDSKNLTQIMHDIVLAIQDLYGMGILHRDISSANIMITVDGRGRLIDLDMAREVYYYGAHRTARVGTWRFMSTQLLTVRGKVHGLSDDLESHFFVLLFESLHFVEHNKPHGIFTESIFDHIDVDPETGSHGGGIGKVALYTSKFDIMDKRLKFTSKPFTTLIWGLYQLFVSLHHYCSAKRRKRNPDESDVRNVGKMEGCVGVVALFDEALKSEEWPTECDKVLDQYPPTEPSEPEQRDSVALSHFNNPLVPEPPNGKRKRGTESEIGHSCVDKRIKVVPPR